jgi:glycolate oxidase iron-sulfur subunit
MNTAARIGQPFVNEARAMACIHCGLCLSSCPTYLETGNENESPRGRIYLMRALQDGRASVEEPVIRHIDSCLGCRACEAVCPSGVEYGNLLEETRDRVEKSFERSPFQTFLRRVAIEQIFPFPQRLKLALMPARFIRSAGLEKFLPASARSAISLLPEKQASIPIPQITPAIGEKRGRVGFISGCVMSVMFEGTNAASVRLLNRSGYDVVTPPGQRCCGALYAHSGRLEMAQEVARANIAVFEREKVDAIIINAAGCGSTLKHYGHLLENDPTWAARAKEFSVKVKDLTEWLEASKIKVPPANEGVKVTYHDACHLAHAQRITAAPRALVKAVAGKNFVEMPEADVCCGSAGTYNLTEPAMAARLQKRKIENILRSGAEVVVTTNPGCILQIQAGLKEATNNRVKVMHIADFLDQEE